MLSLGTVCTLGLRTPSRWCDQPQLQLVNVAGFPRVEGCPRLSIAWAVANKGRDNVPVVWSATEETNDEQGIKQVCGK